MILLFEGCDCVGKTSIINELKKYLQKNSVYKHFSNPPTCKNEMIFNRIQYLNEIHLMNMYKYEVNFIYDRFYFGELVYAPIYRGYTIDYQDFIEGQLNDLNAILVYVYCNEDIIHKRFDNKFIGQDDIKFILNKYSIELAKSKMNNIIYINTSNKTSEQCAKELLKEIYT